MTEPTDDDQQTTARMTKSKSTSELFAEFFTASLPPRDLDAFFGDQDPFFGDQDPNPKPDPTDTDTEETPT